MWGVTPFSTDDNVAFGFPSAASDPLPATANQRVTPRRKNPSLSAASMRSPDDPKGCLQRRTQSPDDPQGVPAKAHPKSGDPQGVPAKAHPKSG